MQVAFFRQFFGSISKVDYLTIRNGFINAHFAPNSKFDFHKYVKRCMEDDFRRVVGISIPLWVFTIILLLLNVHEWYTFTIVSFIPLLVLVLVGTKLELVIMEMAKQIEDRSTVVRGTPVVEPTNDFFWFNRPTWILFLIHFTLFENAFQMAYFLWSWYEFKSIYISCMQEKSFAVLLRVILGVALHILCSYITFPLYALVTQMGSHMKTSIFKEQTTTALKKWQKAAKERKKTSRHGGGGGASPSIDTSSITTGFGGGFMSPEASPSHGTSPIHLLQNYKYRSNNYNNVGGESESIPVSPRTTTPYDSEVELSEMEDNVSPNHSPSRPNHAADYHPNHIIDDENDNGSASTDFTFVQP
ncbi:hypothetical protein LIER_38395 [Lithospermum erythrorhizon]|uniref:MLO-like protein n=1 Tax=Lithospermum erythrorhizon TaxID=34254 RepID=A0AAV3Q376_LITER